MTRSKGLTLLVVAVALCGTASANGLQRLDAGYVSEAPRHARVSQAAWKAGSWFGCPVYPGAVYPGGAAGPGVTVAAGTNPACGSVLA